MTPPPIPTNAPKTEENNPIHISIIIVKIMIILL